jgi:hypothetical protein
MHAYLTRYLKPPAEVTEATKGLGKRVADAFDLRPGTSDSLVRFQRSGCLTDSDGRICSAVPPKKVAKRKDNAVMAEEEYVSYRLANVAVSVLTPILSARSTSLSSLGRLRLRRRKSLRRARRHPAEANPRASPMTSRSPSPRRSLSPKTARAWSSGPTRS